MDGPATNDNGILCVRAMRDGTLQVLDQRSGEKYSGLMTVEDRADIGDGWFHGVAVNDAPETPAAVGVAIACIESGPFVSALRIRRKCPVACAFDFERMRRCEERAVLTIDTVVRLRPGSDIVECETRIDNTALDHRLRLLFPTNAKSASLFADSAFDVVERPIALPADNHKRAELAVETHPMQSWCALSDGRRGLAILATGLHECAAPDLPERPLALTLFRSTRRTYLTDGEPGGQLTGALVFRYAVKFFRGAPDRVVFCRDAQRLAAGVHTVQLRAADQGIHGGPGTLPELGFGFELTGPAVLTSLRRVRGSIEARFFNPQSTKTDARLSWKRCGMEFASAHLVELDGRQIGKPLAIERNGAAVPLGPKQIATLRLEPC
jgi:alpha-mannosidase/mannosylglycerate hydrolase